MKLDNFLCASSLPLAVVIVLPWAGKPYQGSNQHPVQDGHDRFVNAKQAAVALECQTRENGYDEQNDQDLFEKMLIYFDRDMKMACKRNI